MTKRLLLVEDSLTTQKVVHMAFETEDIEIITANDAPTALHQLQALLPDVVVADAALPEIDGFQLCHRIRETAALRHIPVVLLTSNFAAYDSVKGERVGVTSYLSKPFEMEALRQLIQQLLAATSPRAAPVSRALPISPTPAPVPVTPPPIIAPGAPEESAESSQDPQQMEQEALSELDAIVAQWTPGAPLESTPDDLLPQALGHSVLQMIREALQAHLEKLTPQILSTVQEVVTAKAPALLEVLLQREIDKLKRAVENGEGNGEQDSDLSA